MMQQLLQMLLVRLFLIVSWVYGCCCFWHWAATMHVGCLINTECLAHGLKRPPQRGECCLAVMLMSYIGKWLVRYIKRLQAVSCNLSLAAAGRSSTQIGFLFVSLCSPQYARQLISHISYTAHKSDRLRLFSHQLPQALCRSDKLLKIAHKIIHVETFTVCVGFLKSLHCPSRARVSVPFSLFVDLMNLTYENREGAF